MGPVEPYGAPRWSRTYPPLIILALAIVTALLVLPSTLNLPQSNPSTVLEYAPIPPKDDNPNPPNGNLGDLGLGSSGTLSAGGQPPPPPPPPPVQHGTGSKPVTKHCYKDPRTGKIQQTDDPMSPPCVPFWDPAANNFGSTYQGVTKDEITVLVYLDMGAPNSEDTPPPDHYYDLDDPPKPRCPQTFPASNPNSGQCDYIWIRIARAMSLYFNDHFQTYGRHVHYWAYVTMGAPPGAPKRKADAQENWSHLHPFAVIDYATYQGYNDDYDTSMAGRGVLVFQSRAALPNTFFTQIAPDAWGFWPDVEHWVNIYASFICSKVAGGLVQHSGTDASGTDGFNGKTRVYGFFYTTDPGQPGLTLFHKLVVPKLHACGVDSAADGTFSKSGFIVGGSGNTGTDQADAVTKFMQAHVTTVLYLGGSEGKFSQEADAAKYYPEIVLAGDTMNDDNQSGRLQTATVWRNVWGTSDEIRVDDPTLAPGYRAYADAYPDAAPGEARFANEMYRDHFMLFQAIQVAGPKLTPAEVDKGYHAIPPFASDNPYLATFYFDPSDYTGVKDAQEVWWDPSGLSPDGGQPGCMRMVDQGARHKANAWSGPDRAFDTSQNPPCTGYEGRFQLQLG